MRNDFLLNRFKVFMDATSGGRQNGSEGGNQAHLEGNILFKAIRGEKRLTAKEEEL